MGVKVFSWGCQQPSAEVPPFPLYQGRSLLQGLAPSLLCCCPGSSALQPIGFARLPGSSFTPLGAGISGSGCTWVMLVGFSWLPHFERPAPASCVSESYRAPGLGAPLSQGMRCRGQLAFHHRQRPRLASWGELSGTS